MFNIYLVLLIMVFSGLLIFCFMRNHLLLTLMGLEFLTLSLFLIMNVFMTFYSFSYFFILVFLAFSVCEAVLGLGILVSLIRSCGSDMVMSLSILGW